MPTFGKQLAGGKAVSGGALAPRGRRGTSNQVGTYWAGSMIVDVPVLATASAQNASFTVAISNYDSTVVYLLSTTAGSISRSGATITVSGLSASASATITVTGTKSGFENSAPATRSGNAAAACSCVYAYTQVEGGNCCCVGFCGGAANQVCCYNIIVYTPASSPCTGSCGSSVGGWYACDGTC